MQVARSHYFRGAIVHLVGSTNKSPDHRLWIGVQPNPEMSTESPAVKKMSPLFKGSTLAAWYLTSTVEVRQRFKRKFRENGAWLAVPIFIALKIVTNRVATAEASSSLTTT